VEIELWITFDFHIQSTTTILRKLRRDQMWKSNVDPHSISDDLRLSPFRFYGPEFEFAEQDCDICCTTSNSPRNVQEIQRLLKVSA
jgi:hypothetical protein